MKTLLFKLRNNRRGNMLVEFAIGASLLATVFGATFSWGYSFYRYDQLLAQVNAGARYAALRNYDSLTTTPSGGFSAAVKNVVVYGSPSPAQDAKPAVPGLTTSNVVLTVDFNLGVPAGMTVAINNYQINGLFKKVTLMSKPKVRYTYQALWNPAAGGA